jgi:siroheme synthase
MVSLIAAAQAGQRVVRLASGDGLASSDHEIAVLREAGVAVFVVPGVAAAHGGIKIFPSPARSPLSTLTL